MFIPSEQLRAMFDLPSRQANAFRSCPRSREARAALEKTGRRGFIPAQSSVTRQAALLLVVMFMARQKGFRMKLLFLAMGALGLAAAATVPLSSAGTVVAQPQKISKADIAGDIFKRSDVKRTSEEGQAVLDVTTLLSSDRKFATGMYRAGRSRTVISKPYGVDEFMYFIAGGVTLTSSDGKKVVVGAGEAVTIPKEWTGVWETDGYTKIWVIYSADGSGL